MKKVKALIFDWGDTLMRDFREYSGAMVHWPHVEMMPGTADALADLQERYLCCVASNAGVSDAELMGQALARVGLRQYFDYLFTSKDLGAANPSPEFFRAILTAIGAEPEECIMVGNDYAKDIASAKAVGLRTIWLAEGDVHAEALGAEVASGSGGIDNVSCAETFAADVVIESMAQLVEAVERLDVAMLRDGQEFPHPL